jgi:exopolysaccharide biosynthesis polyprenyl glycosylphosphotransferase
MTHRLMKANAFPRAVVVSRVGNSTHIADLIDSDPVVPLRVVERMEIHRDEHMHAEVIDKIVAAADRNFAHSVVLDTNLDLNGAVIAEISWLLDQRGIELLAAPSFLGSWAGRLIIERHPSLPLVALSEPRLSVMQQVEKRFLDLLIALPVFVLLIPVYIVIALAVAVTSPGPILFVQNRVGVDGQLFRFMKFRTMRDGAHLSRLDVLGRPDEDMLERYRNDPRITPVGKFLRRFSMDELPQIWHVITGDMSIVGPRPMLEEELSQMQGNEERRRLFKPGLTGLWQISGRKETTFEERMQIDLRYIDEWTLGLDLAIIAKTFGVVLSGKGSY